MSIKTYTEAIESTIQSEMNLHTDLIAFRPGARRALDEDERSIPMPRMNRAAFSAALGAALTGMHALLDLRQDDEAACLLPDCICSLPAGCRPAITILSDALHSDALSSLPGVRLFAPKNPRQAAGFMRAALRMGSLTLLLADSALAGEEADVPEDDGFMLLPLDEPCEDSLADDDDEIDGFLRLPPDEPDPEYKAAGASNDQDSSLSAEEETGEQPDSPEEIADNEANKTEKPESILPGSVKTEITRSDEPMPEEAAVCRCMPALRSVPCSTEALDSLTRDLGAPPELLLTRCMETLSDRFDFEWTRDTGALPGECAYLPSERAAAKLWLGADMLCLYCDAARMPGDTAAGLLRSAKRIIEKPALLIYDKERDAQ